MPRPIDVATNLSRPDINVALSQPVDRSGAILGEMSGQAARASAQAISTRAQAMSALSRVIPQAVETGLDVHKGMALADLQQQHNSEIDLFLARRNAPELATDAAALDLASNSLWDKLGKGATTNDIDKVQQSFQDRSMVLKKALDEGAIDVNELETRLLALTRQSINKNPGLQNELINHAEKILHLSGVRSLRDTNNKLVDQEQKFLEETRKKLNTDVSKYNVPHDAFRMNDPDYLRFINEQVNERKQAEFTWNQAQQAAQAGITLDTEQSKQWIRTNGDKYIQGGLFDFYSAAQQIAAKHGNNIQAAINEIDALSTFQKEAVRSQFSQNGALASPEGKDTLNRFNTLMDSVNDRATRATTMADLKQGLDNTQSIMSSNEVIGMMKSGINLTAARIASSFSDEIAKWNLHNPDIASKLINLHASLLDQAYGSNVKEFFAGYGNLENGRSDAVTLLEKPAKLNDIDVFKRMVEGFATVEKQIDNDQAKMDFFTDLSRTFSRSDYLKFFRAHPDGTLASQVFGMVDRAITNMGGAVKRDSKDEQYSANVMPGGDGITISYPNDRRTELELNSKYAKQFNDFIKVYAAMNGVSTKQAFEAIAPRYQSTFNIQGLKEVSPNIQQKIIGVESGGNPNAKNPKSSASGSAQFIKDTWINVMNKHFSELTEGKSEEQILAMRKNPNLNKLAEQMFRSDNQNILEQAGIPVNDASIYLAHFLGADATKKVIQANPATPINEILGEKAIDSNESILKGKTTSQVINWAHNKMASSF